MLSPELHALFDAPARQEYRPVLAPGLDPFRRPGDRLEYALLALRGLEPREQRSTVETVLRHQFVDVAQHVRPLAVVGEA